MGTEAPVQTCPSCKIGTLVRTDESAEGQIKYFSCGHELRDLIFNVTAGEVTLSVGRVGLENRLGPHNIQPVSYTRGVSADAFIVSMQQEMYKDAIHFIHEARRCRGTPDTDPFAVWRNIRAAIFFSFAAIESAINQFIGTHVEQTKAKMSPEEVDRWTEKKGHMGIRKKLNKGMELFGGKRLEDDKTLWRSFEDLRGLRDGLVHYKVENRVPYNTDEFLERAENGVKTASAVIKKICLPDPANRTYPEIFDKLP